MHLNNAVVAEVRFGLIHAALEVKHQLGCRRRTNGHRVEPITHLDMAIHEAEICEHEK